MIEVVIRRKNMIPIGEEKIRRGVREVLLGYLPETAHGSLEVTVRLEPGQSANRIEIAQERRIGGVAFFDAASIKEPDVLKRRLTAAVNGGLSSHQRSVNFTFTSGWEERATPKATDRRNRLPTHYSHVPAQLMGR